MQTHIHLHEISRLDTLPMRKSCHICIKLDFDTAGNTSLKLPKSKAALQTYAGLLHRTWQIAEAVDPKEAWRELHKRYSSINNTLKN